MPQPQVQATGWCLASRRWHEDRLWLSDFGASGVVAIDLQGPSEVIAPVARRSAWVSCPIDACPR